ncbi:glycosyltransferase family 4 protein [Hyalangium minutum]|uniref:Glycosyltransferase n=1 Tax=Hyalangium minutum TaxID=394096 RepID=A0A085VYV0_9BACT|nr:glycosyltransferase family 4 protein [Hyalangium minutum]KFE60613.1 Glycosyltransferase [Hyalangium minutum]
MLAKAASRSGVRRVLMTAETTGGVWTYALELTRALAAPGVEVTLATLGAPLTPGQWHEARALPNLRVEQSTFQLEWMDEPWADVKAAGEWLLGLEARVRPDVVHLNGYCHGALPWSSPTLMVGHSCVLSWWRAVRGEDAPERYRRYQAEVARGLRAAGKVVAPTRAMLGALREHYGPLPEAEVIVNARRPDGFPPRARREPFILTAGRLWDEAKNVAALEAAAPRLRWPVKVAGETQLPPREEGSHPRRVEALGWLSPQELAGWMGRAAIYALPARYEPFGLSVLEAALAGCALVLGDIPSLREVWGDDAAIFISPTDVEALTEALECLRCEPGRLARLAACARVRALEYGPARMCANYLAAYASLVRMRRGHPVQPEPSSRRQPTL